MSVSGVKALFGFVLFSIVKHAPRSDEFLIRILIDMPEGFNGLPFVTWNDFVMGFWIYSDKILLMIPVYLVASVILPYLYLRVE